MFYCSVVFMQSLCNLLLVFFVHTFSRYCFIVVFCSYSLCVVLIMGNNLLLYFVHTVSG